MKYKAKQLNNGKWAVFSGKKYFKSTVTDNKNDATILACERSAQWHHAQIDQCSLDWEKAHRAGGKLAIYEDNATSENSLNFDVIWSNLFC